MSTPPKFLYGHGTLYLTLSLRSSNTARVMPVIVTTECNSRIQLKDLLCFITGADCIPPLGFPTSINIDFYDRLSSRHYPTASTCDMRLWLPRGVQDSDELQMLMEEAVVGAHGFDKC